MQTSGGELAYNSSPSFYAAQVPSGSTQVPVSTDPKAEQILITWKGV